MQAGNSLRRPLSYSGGNVFTVDAQGASNGFVMTTFSLPASIVVPSGHQAIYNRSSAPARGMR